MNKKNAIYLLRRRKVLLLLRPGFLVWLGLLVWPFPVWTQTRTEGAVRSDGSIKNFEEIGFVLGGPVSEIKCPSPVSIEQECGRVCRIGRSRVCFTDEPAYFTELQFDLPGKCEGENLRKLINPHETAGERVSISGSMARFASGRLGCGKSIGEEPFVEVRMQFNNDIGQIINIMNSPPETKMYGNGKASWFQGWVADLADVEVSQNFCAKTHEGSVARVIDRGTGLVGMAGPNVVRPSNRRVLDTKFGCYQKIQADFAEGQFSSLADKIEESNGLLPPSKQKSPESIRKVFTDKLVRAGRDKVKCPKGFSRVSESYELTNDAYEVECQTELLSISSLCPKDSEPTINHVGGGVERNKVGGSISTLIYEASSSCFKQECYPGSFSYRKNYCGVCPKGTMFDPKETAAHYAKDKLAAALRPGVILCKGAPSLKIEPAASSYEQQDEQD